MAEETAWRYEQYALTVLEGLKRRGISAYFASSRREALELVLELVPPQATVGWGDSMTLEQVGVFAELRQRNRVYDAFQRKADGSLTTSREEHFEIERQAMLADCFLTSASALTLDGKIVNIDGHGNRVAPTLFGPRKVIFVVGANKIVADVDEAISRIKNYAAPMNAKRHMLKHKAEVFADLPCVKRGVCADCRHRARICNKVVIIEGEGSMEPERTHVIIVGEALGI
ncbi:MAG: lactate utilization protein [Chloroflexota bacterium]